MEDKLVFIIGSPRSGSTMLQRMVSSHSNIFTHPEPHLLTPLAHLGYFHNVDKAPYDHINASKAMHEFVDELPNKQDDYLEACRAYSDTLYRQALVGRKEALFLDKTPAYSLITDFLSLLYPNAKYIVLTRHPLAILSSYANSFFDGDYDAAYSYNPILDRYVPSIASFLRAKAVPMHHVRYEDVVKNPEAALEGIFSFLDIEHEPEAANYGKHSHIKKSFGDPNVDSHARPVTSSVERWAKELANDPHKLQRAQGILDGLSDEDLDLWGYPRETILDALKDVQVDANVEAPSQRINAYRVQRKVLLKLRKNIHDNNFGRLVKGVRYYCDVLLRD